MSSELKRRIAVTVGALLVYRLGLFIPVPGIDLSVWAVLFRSQTGGLLGQFDLLSGGGIHRLAIFSLTVVPYISAAIMLQIAAMMSRRLRALSAQGERGRQLVRQFTCWLTAALAASQAYGIAIGLQDVPGLVAEPGWLFVLSTVLTLTAGVMVVMWLSEQITRQGIGNGLALMLLAGIVTEVPSMIAGALQLGDRGLISSKTMIGLLAMLVAVTAFAVLMERARRRLPIEFSKHQVGALVLEARSSHLPFKLNAAGIIPVVLASWILSVVLIFANLSGGPTKDWWTDLVGLGTGRPLPLLFYAVLIAFCAFFYTAFVLDPEDTAKNLKNHGGCIPGIAPGEATAEHVDRVLSRMTIMGMAYLVLVCVLPEFVIAKTGVPFYFSATSLLIVICATLDLEEQVRAHMRSA